MKQIGNTRDKRGALGWTGTHDTLLSRQSPLPLSYQGSSPGRAQSLQYSTKQRQTPNSVTSQLDSMHVVHMEHVVWTWHVVRILWYGHGTWYISCSMDMARGTYLAVWTWHVVRILQYGHGTWYISCSMDMGCISSQLVQVFYMPCQPLL